MLNPTYTFSTFQPSIFGSRWVGIGVSCCCARECAVVDGSGCVLLLGRTLVGGLLLGTGSGASLLGSGNGRLLL